MQAFISLPKIIPSPRMQVTTAPFATRLPKQLQRALPIYVVVTLLFVLFLSRHNTIQTSPIVADALKRVLSPQVPSLPIPRAFPKKIWQTWKVDPLAFEERDLTRAKSWTAMNPGYRYEVLTDGNDMNYVETHFGPSGFNRLDIVSTYRSLTAQIVKADLLRYLVMYVEGGVYADIDVEAMKPVDTFIPANRYNPRDVDLVVGVEIDEPEFKDHPILGPKSQSFCQWTFMAKPRVPVMLKLVDNIIKWLNDVASKQSVPISEITLDFDQVLTGTGPSAFTRAILAEITTNSGRPMNWDYFHNITEPKLIGGVLVLTVKAFAAGQGHSNSATHDSPEAVVKHHYHASRWPTRHPRFAHPVYREVELCNWNKTCVQQWDADTTAFKSIPKEQQTVMIAEAKERLDKEIAERVAAEKEEADRIAAEKVAASPCPAPTEPAQPAEPAQPVEGNNPAEGTQQPNERNNPVDGAQQVQSNQPNEENKPAEGNNHVDGNS